MSTFLVFLVVTQKWIHWGPLNQSSICTSVFSLVELSAEWRKGEETFACGTQYKMYLHAMGLMGVYVPIFVFDTLSAMYRFPPQWVRFCHLTGVAPVMSTHWLASTANRRHVSQGENQC